ncbi:MAG: glycosyltransferase family 39 protein [bacterium]
MLILILLLGAGLRFYHLGTEDLWLDEILTLKFASVSWSDITFNRLDSDAITHFLSDYIIMHLWLNLGKSAAMLRLFSALVGIITIAVMFAVGCRLFNSRIGLFGALLLAISSYHIFYSQEARAYALQTLLILSVVYFFYRAGEEHKIRFWIFYSFISILAIYLQVFSIFSIIALDIYVLIQLCFSHKRVQLIPWLISQIAILIFCLPYLIYIIQPSIYAERLAWIPKPGLQDIANMVALFSCGRIFWVVPEYLRRFIAVLYLFPVLLSCISFNDANRKPSVIIDRSSGTMLTWSLFIIPIILFYTISFKRPIFVADRYLIITLPFFYLLAAYGITKLEHRALKYIITGILVCGMLIGLYAHYHNPTKIRWSQIARVIEQNRQQTDLVLIHPYYQATSLSYYLKEPVSLDSIDDIDRIWEITNGHPRTWLIILTDWVNKPSGAIYSRLSSRYQRQQMMLAISNPTQVDIILYDMPGYIPDSTRNKN